MSRILRRPMFRGGRVSSYGTGIASGLADGGMPPKRGLVDGPGGYAGWRNYPTGTDILKKNISGPITLQDFMESYQGGNYAGRNITDLIFEKEVGSEGDVVEVGLKDLDIDARSDQEKAIEKDIRSETSIKEEIKENPEIITHLVTSNQGDGDGDGDGDTGDTNDTTTSIGDAESELQKQADEYFKLLGGDKAKAGEISNMLLRFAGSKGDTVMEKFTDFAAAESKIPSETKKIKQAAAMAAIKGEQAKETAMYAMQKGVALKLAGLTDTKKDRATTTRLGDYAKEFMKDVTNPFKQKNAGAFAAAQVLSENLLDKQGEFVSVMVYDEAGEAKPVSGAIYIDPIQGMAAGTPFYYNGKFYKTLAEAKKIKSGG
jgi:hypothetical protein